MNKVLDVYYDQEQAGTLTQDKSGSLSFTYLQDYVDKDSFPLSISLPLTKEVFEGTSVKAFFSGLLPDAPIRRKLAKLIGVSDSNPFALLKALGRECSGAVSVCPHGKQPKRAKTDSLKEIPAKDLESILLSLPKRPLAWGTPWGSHDLRMSLAGAQEKLGLRMHNGKVLLRAANSLTTHILKTPIEYLEDSVYNEFFCMRLAQKMEIETPKVDLLRIKNVSYFVIERYDRKNVQHHTLPIHQEDFCQALGVLPELKYENEGGPNIAQCARLIAQNSIRPPHDKQQFLDRIIFNFLIGNNDAHGKNYSFLYLQRQPQLAPAYDLLSTEIYPELSKKMAMKIGGKYKPNEVFLRHWHKTFAQGLLGQHILEQHLQFFSQTLITKSEMLAQELGQSEIYSPVFNQIIRFITLRAKTFSSF